jgi:two-component system nitrate/nitrite response regulator NarL
MVNVFIVSSSESRRDALRRALESDEVRVVGEADPRSAADGGRPAAAVLLLDGEEALEAVGEAEDDWPPAFVLLVGRLDRAVVGRIRQIDATGWTVLPADAAPDRLRAGVMATAAGLAALPIDWREELGLPAPHDGIDEADAADGGDEADEGDGDRILEALTGREAEVLEWMARGLSNRQIGLRLGISEHTAKFHVASVLGKLGARNRADAVRRGVRRGWVTV